MARDLRRHTREPVEDSRKQRRPGFDHVRWPSRKLEPVPIGHEKMPDERRLAAKLSRWGGTTRSISQVVSSRPVAGKERERVSWSQRRRCALELRVRSTPMTRPFPRCGFPRHRSSTCFIVALLRGTATSSVAFCLDQVATCHPAAGKPSPVPVFRKVSLGRLQTPLQPRRFHRRQPPVRSWPGLALLRPGVVPVRGSAAARPAMSAMS